MQLSVFYDHILEAANQSGQSVLEVMKQVKGFGIDFIDITFEDYENNKETLDTTLVESGLKVGTFIGKYGPENAASYAFLEESAKLGITTLLIIPGFLDKEETEIHKELCIKVSENPEDKSAVEKLYKFLDESKRVQAIIERLRLLVFKASELGVTLTIEDYDDYSSPNTLFEELIYFTNQVPGLRITFDTGNFAFNKQDALLAYEDLRNYVAHVHLKDRARELVDGEENYLVPVAVGDGYVPIYHTLMNLKKDSYAGKVVIEHYGHANQLEAMKKSAENIKTFLGER